MICSSLNFDSFMLESPLWVREILTDHSVAISGFMSVAISPAMLSRIV
jgi:hypothetical protein